VSADPVQIQQVVINLISNAVDAVKGLPGRRRVLRLSTACIDREVTVFVADLGEGVGEQDAEQIFAHMFTTKPDGIGLGLPISKAIVESHGGRIHMRPNDPCGTVFGFSLPAAEAR
jgi:two-component system sensor histidine kinase TtrS